MTIPSDHYMSPPEPNLVKEVRTQYIIEDGIVAVKTTTRKYYGDGDYQDDFGVEIGETDDEFKVIIKTDNLKLMPMDYEVTICSKGISEFKGDNVTYFVAIDSKSTYNKG